VTRKAAGISRRQFLRIIGVGGVAGATALNLGLKTTSATESVSETRLLMGTVVNLTLVSADLVTARAAVAACFRHMTRLEAVMSRHQPDSQLSRLNRDGRLEGADAHLVDLVRLALEVSVLTEGAFDVTVKPLVDLYQERRQTGALPDAASLTAVLERVDYRRVALENDSIAFALPGMGITLDGIAKGYIVDQGTAILRDHGFANVLVEAGGDLSTFGAPQASRPWQVGIQPPRQDSPRLLRAFGVTNRAVATSGDYLQPYTPDFREHHILDPRSGHSAPHVASATVIAASCVQADALATALMVMPSAQSLRLVESLHDVEACLVTKDERLLKSSGFRFSE